MIILFFAVITAVTYSLRTFQENQFKISASYILQASIDKIRSLPFASLTQRTDAPLTGITFNFGSWETAQDANAPSSPNVLRLLKPHSPPPGGGDVAAIITAPSSNVENGDLEAEIKLNSSSRVLLQDCFLEARTIFPITALFLTRAKSNLKRSQTARHRFCGSNPATLPPRRFIN